MKKLYKRRIVLKTVNPKMVGMIMIKLPNISSFHRSINVRVKGHKITWWFSKYLRANSRSNEAYIHYKGQSTLSFPSRRSSKVHSSPYNTQYTDNPSLHSSHYRRFSLHDHLVRLKTVKVRFYLSMNPPRFHHTVKLYTSNHSLFQT